MVCVQVQQQTTSSLHVEELRAKGLFTAAAAAAPEHLLAYVQPAECLAYLLAHMHHAMITQHVSGRQPAAAIMYTLQRAFTSH